MTEVYELAENERIGRLAIKFADAKNGTQTAVAWEILASQPDGSDKTNNLEVISRFFIPQLVEEFNFEALGERDAAVASLATATVSHTTAIAALNSTIASKDSELAAVNAILAELQATIWDKRKIDPEKWYDRMTMDQVLAISLAAGTDPIVNSFVVALKESRQLRKDDPTYLMSLDHPNAVAGVAYLSGEPIVINAQGDTATIATPVLKVDEAVALRADSRRDEQ